MTKKLGYMFFWLNATFFILNAVLIYIVPVPAINLICALISLVGAMCSWQLYTKADDDD